MVFFNFYRERENNYGNIFVVLSLKWSFSISTEKEKVSMENIVLPSYHSRLGRAIQTGKLTVRQPIQNKVNSAEPIEQYSSMSVTTMTN